MADKENDVPPPGEVQAEDDSALNEVETKVSEELRANLSRLESEFRASFDERMASFAEQCETEKAQEIAEKKKEVLIINKILRDVSRQLGAKWKPLFERLLRGLPADKIRSEVAKIENEKPFIQAFKSLTAWKEIRAAEFDVKQLIGALQDCDLHDIAATVSKTLNADESELFNISRAVPGNSEPGRSAASSASKPQPSPEAVAAAAAASRERLAAKSAEAFSSAGKNEVPDGTSSSSTAAPKPSNGVEKLSLSEALDDRHILQLAKKIGGEWEALGKALNVSDEELKEILDSEGKSYQGAFKLLWNWRDNIDPMGQENIDKLKSALAKINRVELAMMYP